MADDTERLQVNGLYRSPSGAFEKRITRLSSRWVWYVDSMVETPKYGETKSCSVDQFRRLYPAFVGTYKGDE